MNVKIHDNVVDMLNAYPGSIRTEIFNLFLQLQNPENDEIIEKRTDILGGCYHVLHTMKYLVYFSVEESSREIRILDVKII